MHNPKILVIEDERDIAKVISINLKMQGMEVVLAHDGDTAAKRLAEFVPDCILLDILLPGKSGWELLTDIRANPATSAVPVIMLTGLISEKDQLRGLSAGATKYLTKPFSPTDLVEAVESVLKPQAQENVARERRESIERLQLSAIYRISDILISTPDLHELLAGVAERLILLLDIPVVAIALSDTDEPEGYVFKRGVDFMKEPAPSTRHPVNREMLARIEEAFRKSSKPVHSSRIPGFRIGEFISDPGVSAVFRDSPSQAGEDGEAPTGGYMLPLFEASYLLGAVFLVGKERASLSPDEIELLATIGNQVAAAILRARLHENLREDEVIHRRLLHQTITAQESERKRLAGEIHDGIVQTLVGISYRLQAINQRIEHEKNGHEEDADTLLGSLGSEMETLNDALSDSIKDLRGLLLGLRPPMLDDLGLFAALDAHLKNFASGNGLSATIKRPDDEPSISRDAQINIFRLIQEALNNVEKHSRATQVRVEIDTTPRKLLISIIDNGRGFSPQKARENTKSLGIANMQERTDLLGGTLKIQSEPGRGTAISCTIPLRPIREESHE